MAVSSLVIRSLFRSSIPALFRQGYSFNAAADYMKGMTGGLYRRQLAQADWREITGAQKLSESFRFIPKKYRLSFGLTTPRAGVMSTNYQYLFRISGLIDDKGQPTHRWTSLLDDVRMSPQEAEDIINEQLADPADPSPDVVIEKGEKLELFIVYRNRDVIFRR